MYNEMKINIKIFYYTIKKIEPQTLARKGFFVTTPPEQIGGKGVDSKETRSLNSDDLFHRKPGLLSEPP